MHLRLGAAQDRDGWGQPVFLRRRSMYQEESFKTQRVVYAHTRSDEGDMEYKMHCHDVYEVYYMISGNAEYLLEGRTYTPRPGSLIIIPPGCFHGLRVLDSDEYNRIRLHFAPELLQEEEQALLLEPFGTGWCCYEEQFQLEWYFHSLEECGNYGKDLQDIAIRTRVLSLLTKIFAIYREASGTSRGKEGQVQEIIRYINQNLSAPLSLEGLAQTFYMSKNHLTAVFKRATGTTVARYILYKRMAIVRKELSMGVPAAEAASRAGFGDYSSFFRAYKKMFGCAPSDKSAPGMPEMDQGSMV